MHLPSASVATIHCGAAAQRLSRVPLMCFRWSLPVFHNTLCPVFAAGPLLNVQLFDENISKFKDTCVILRPICNLCPGLNEATQNAESLCQVESLDGNFPAAFSGNFHYSVCVCVCRRGFTLYNLFQGKVHITPDMASETNQCAQHQQQVSWRKQLTALHHSTSSTGENDRCLTWPSGLLC